MISHPFGRFDPRIAAAAGQTPRLRMIAGGRSGGARGLFAHGPVDDCHFDLLFEPVIRLQTGRTVYYRAGLALLNADGVPCDSKILRKQAWDQGWLGKLELLTFTRSAPAVRHLRARRPDAGIFCSVGARALADDAFLGELVAFMKREPDIAGSLVIEIPHRAVARLSPDGVRGLAYLAQLGATFSLAGSHARLRDLENFADLGFIFIALEARSLTQVARTHPLTLAGLTDQADRYGISLIAGDVFSRDQAEAMSPFVTLAHGPLYSPPRPVRRDLTVVENSAKVA